MVENTVRCNLHCALCDRDTLLATRRSTSMSLEDAEVVAKSVAEYGISRVSYFNLGEPFLSPRIHEEIALLRKYNPGLMIITSTNGVHLDTDSKRDAALMMDLVFFSVDGASQESLVRYQVGGHFERSYENMRRLVAARADVLAADPSARVPEIEWKYVVFRWNDSADEIERALDLAREAGVDRIVFYPGVAKRADRSIRFHTAPLFAQLGPIVDGGICIELP
jgi:MoaA/NifB/PqqE/SkfB family radical SAM enzyme